MGHICHFSAERVIPPCNVIFLLYKSVWMTLLEPHTCLSHSLSLFFSLHHFLLSFTSLVALGSIRIVWIVSPWHLYPKTHTYTDIYR